jgi:hypothetical protein
MTATNLTQNLINKLQILPLQQQQVLDSLEDPDLLTTLSPAELQALANLSLGPQAQLSDLLARNANGEISPKETAILDQLLAQVDQLNPLKARAHYTLQYLSRSDAAHTSPSSSKSKFSASSRIAAPIARQQNF